MTDQINARKTEHLRAIENDSGIERTGSGFDTLTLQHRALPEISLNAVDTSVSLLGKTLRFPLLISSMTGGDGAETRHINRNLAQAAESCGVAMAVGSQRVMFSNEGAKSAFQLREYAPSVPLIANIGAVQLNTGFTVDEYEQAVTVLDADGLYLHLNPLQEAIQPEGDTDFSNLAVKIAKLSEHLQNRYHIPVLLKEVGSGFSATDIELGLASGIRIFDVAGRGGTSWSRIEYHRRTHDQDDLGLVFQDWGLTTVESLTIAAKTVAQHKDCTLIASGGIRNGIDMAKACVLGAHVCGAAAPFLAAAQDSAEAVEDVIRKFEREFKTAMFLLGCKSFADIHGNRSLLVYGLE